MKRFVVALAMIVGALALPTAAFAHGGIAVSPPVSVSGGGSQTLPDGSDATIPETVTNFDTVPVVWTGMTVTYQATDVNGVVTYPTAVECPELVGKIIRPGKSISCSFVLVKFAGPGDGQQGVSTTGTAVVQKTNSPEGVGLGNYTVYSTMETVIPTSDVSSAPAGATVGMHSVFKNTGLHDLTITTWNVNGVNIPACTLFVGTVVTAGSSVTCNFTVKAPAVGGYPYFYTFVTAQYPTSDTTLFSETTNAWAKVAGV